MVFVESTGKEKRKAARVVLGKRKRSKKVNKVANDANGLRDGIDGNMIGDSQGALTKSQAKAVGDVEEIKSAALPSQNKNNCTSMTGTLTIGSIWEFKGKED